MSKLTTYSILVVILCIVIVLYQPSSIPDSAPPGEYSLRPAISPKLTGFGLLIAQKLLRIPFLSNLLIQLLNVRNDFECIDRLAYHLHMIPTYLPFHVCTDKELEEHQRMHAQDAYSKLLFDPKVRESMLYASEEVHDRQTNYAKHELLTIESIHKSYVSKKLTPIQLVEQALTFAEKDLKHLHLFIQLNKTDVLLQARESALRWEQGKPLS
ncbi:hypothetical protein RFI_15106, partial [Reticulomyxa filosa]